MRPVFARSRFETKILLLAIGVGAPGGFLGLWFLWAGDYSTRVVWSLSALVVGSWMWLAWTLRDTVIRPVQTLSNMLSALAEGDYTIRARSVGEDDVFGLAVAELNSLSEVLRTQRYSKVEAEALLRSVMDEIDVAIFAFDDGGLLQLVNRAGGKFLLRNVEDILGKTAAQLELEECLVGNTPRIVDMSSNTNPGEWELRRSVFRLDGLPHSLVVLSDLSRILRGQERETWKRIIRVLSHEINNSLAPIKSIAETLQGRVSSGQLAEETLVSLEKGLSVIQGRADSLNVFMASYAKLAKLPAPTFSTVSISELVGEVVGLETRLNVKNLGGPDLTIRADGAQLGQLLVNCVKNAVEAASETEGEVEIGWGEENGDIELWVRDTGPGFSDTKNLFVPFYSTKPKGSGIGLVLCRQIAEGHDGSLDLENRSDGPGCIVRLRLPKD